MRYTIIAGLGNPGKEYSDTYHNTGSMALDLIAADERYKKHGIFEYAKHGPVILVRPLTFMNESGEAIAEAVRFFRRKPGDLLVIHDDSDIELGEYKLSCSRGSAGHNGVKSIIASLGTKGFCRLRIGIRLPESRERAGNMVLKKIGKNDMEKLETTVKKALEETGITSY